MAESAKERLQRIAAERRAKEQTNGQQHSEPVVCSGSNDNAEPVPSVPAVQETAASTVGATAAEPEVSTASVPVHDVAESASSSSGRTSADLPVRAAATHPIAMEMAELESALNQQVPGFHTILRDIHIKLREDPNTVTLLSEDEIALIVKGLERHANVTLTAKAAKPTARAKKTPISATDL